MAHTPHLRLETGRSSPETYARCGGIPRMLDGALLDGTCSPTYASFTGIESVKNHSASVPGLTAAWVSARLGRETAGLSRSYRTPNRAISPLFID